MAAAFLGVVGERRLEDGDGSGEQNGEESPRRLAAAGQGGDGTLRSSKSSRGGNPSVAVELRRLEGDESKRRLTGGFGGATSMGGDGSSSGTSSCGGGRTVGERSGGRRGEASAAAADVGRMSSSSSPRQVEEGADVVGSGGGVDGKEGGGGGKVSSGRIKAVPGASLSRRLGQRLGNFLSKDGGGETRRSDQRGGGGKGAAAVGTGGVEGGGCGEHGDGDGGSVVEGRSANSPTETAKTTTTDISATANTTTTTGTATTATTAKGDGGSTGQPVSATQQQPEAPLPENPTAASRLLSLSDDDEAEGRLAQSSLRPAGPSPSSDDRRLSDVVGGRWCRGGEGRRA